MIGYEQHNESGTRTGSVHVLVCSKKQVDTDRMTVLHWNSSCLCSFPALAPGVPQSDGGGQDGLTDAAQNRPVLLAVCWTQEGWCHLQT